MDIKKIYGKYKDIMPYLLFGVCTTLVNVVIYWLIAHLLNGSTMLSTIIAWIVAVLFAYVTNRKWVFYSEAKGICTILREMVSFICCRLATGVFDWACMFIFVEIFVWNDVLVKLGANVVVIILNYLASKFVIFKKNKISIES